VGAHPVAVAEEEEAAAGNHGAMKTLRGVATLIVLDRNLFEIPASEIIDATITATIFDGRTDYQKEDK
jgi:predicted amidohydrolase YtcJ